MAGKRKTENVSARYAVTRQSTSMRRSRMTSVNVSTAAKKKNMIGRVVNATDVNTNVPIQRVARTRAADVPVRHAVCGFPTSM